MDIVKMFLIIQYSNQQINDTVSLFYHIFCQTSKFFYAEKCLVPNPTCAHYKHIFLFFLYFLFIFFFYFVYFLLFCSQHFSFYLFPYSTFWFLVNQTQIQHQIPFQHHNSSAIHQQYHVVQSAQLNNPSSSVNAISQQDQQYNLLKQQQHQQQQHHQLQYPMQQQQLQHNDINTFNVLQLGGNSQNVAAGATTNWTGQQQQQLISQNVKGGAVPAASQGQPYQAQQVQQPLQNQEMINVSYKIF